MGVINDNPHTIITICMRIFLNFINTLIVIAFSGAGGSSSGSEWESADQINTSNSVLVKPKLNILILYFVLAHSTNHSAE